MQTQTTPHPMPMQETYAYKESRALDKAIEGLSTIHGMMPYQVNCPVCQTLDKLVIQRDFMKETGDYIPF